MWEWFIPHLFMVMTGGWLIIDLANNIPNTFSETEFSAHLDQIKTRAIPKYCWLSIPIHSQ